MHVAALRPAPRARQEQPPAREAQRNKHTRRATARVGKEQVARERGTKERGKGREGGWTFFLKRASAARTPGSHARGEGRYAALSDVGADTLDRKPPPCPRRLLVPATHPTSPFHQPTPSGCSATLALVLARCASVVQGGSSRRGGSREADSGAVGVDDGRVNHARDVPAAPPLAASEAGAGSARSEGRSGGRRLRTAWSHSRGTRAPPPRLSSRTILAAPRP
eukprot:882846-Rhodomonas_salina.1